MMSLDAFAALADEIRDARPTMEVDFSRIFGTDDEGARRSAIELYLEQVRRIRTAAEILELAGLQQACRHIENNVSCLVAPHPIAPESRVPFTEWPEAVLAYLRTPHEKSVVEGMVDRLCDAAWPLPLSAADSHELRGALLSVEVASQSTSARPSVAISPDDVLLEPDPSVNPRVFEAFLNEGAAGAAAYAELMHAFTRGEGNQNALQEARRVVHTLKGAANTVGVRGIAALAHHVEDVLEMLAVSGRMPTGPVAQLLNDVADCMGMMFDTLIHGHEPPPHTLTLLESLMASRHEDSVADSLVENPIADSRTAPEKTVDQSRSADSTRGASEQRLAIPVASMNQLLRIASDNAIGQAHANERIHQVLRALDELIAHATVLRLRTNEVEEILLLGGIGGSVTDLERTRRSVSEFDSLELDHLSELHGRLYALIEGVSDIEAMGKHVNQLVMSVDEATKAGGERARALHDSLVQARMVPAGSQRMRLAQVVQRTASMLGKQAALNFAGDEVMLDSQILKDLVDPIAHLVRNAVDHGLEPSADRIRMGKPANGTVTVSFARIGNEIVIQVGDDGRGLDLTRIREVAATNSVLPPGADIGNAELVRLILAPGFSTADTVSYTSGRGVGLDVVQTQVQKLKGDIDIASEAGAGCLFTVRFPVTLGLAYCLLVGVDEHIVAIPTDAIDRAVYRGAAQIESGEGDPAYSDEDGAWEAQELGTLIGYGSTKRAAGDDARSIILVMEGGKRYALIVDALLEGADLVIKNPGAFLASVPGLVGASLLPDGRIVPVLDLNSLLRRSKLSLRCTAPAPVSEVLKAGAPDILVVDDSHTVRIALSELLSTHGFTVRTARDGVEALELIQASPPALVILDLEMPRMNGLELATRLREQEPTKQLPIILITSRSSGKHRIQAEIAGIDLYLTKPYLDSELLTHLRHFLDIA